MKRNNYYSALIALLTLAMLGSCQREKTTYIVEYEYDNTDMKTELMKVFECDSQGLANGKWRASHHSYDTINTSEGQRIIASGKVDEVAREGCTTLEVFAENFGGSNTWELDTIFELKINEENHFYINSDMKWKKR
ncbi:MAG: hypothetical protein MJZ67_02885 [Bacteroidales bacterium]|nr:hypothetical protein [Bacteroidales bacterium]